MATAKVRGLVFDGWWRERVIVAAGASVSLGELFADYRRDCHGAGMSLESFVARLASVKVKVVKHAGKRTCFGVRLRVEADGASAAAREPGVAAANMARDAAASALALAAAKGGQAAQASAASAPLYRLTAIVPGVAPDSVGVMLEFDAADEGAEASARVAHELFGERRRQVAPTDAGGEGWTVAHDDVTGRLAEGDLAHAACAHAFAAAQPDEHARFLELGAKLERPPIRRGWLVVEYLRAVWPWDVAWWKPRTDREGWRRRCLVKAGALIIAAIEKLDRADARAKLSAEEAKLATGV